ncbi:hypothetical protein ABIE85_007107 [Bradyrhizobium diazoefficiens]|jgi:hypothetical protein|uniref:Uncharacterized protein n=1 Tax=Bradyrhizobium diazoefficiens TaxID=1355477 RepID=A0A809XJN3_9BRAD|nr:hypothetical protein [Bradyrhizobium diazoefficiens]MBP1060183.1 hypothetical protein [Bradyrhizobium japonicum]AWO88235.1 hypothetical protein DI395_06455 [Bradyrhizobium diazoefficiens]WLA57462.1 hypothetical protein QIH81_01565 [Bradyrhizobium diazoefficiens]BCA00293.1 hypothetical protein H12S4_11970 [Bradyrhizobium diazoefficiens]BCA17977.1 hypothetical protein BDHH15_11920 [Bradyrhizobium diazoefficiens]
MAKLTLNGYGHNQAALPSSLTHGEDVEKSPYAPPLSDAHESVVANGVASNPQVRKIDPRPEVAAGYGMRDRRADAVKIPPKTSR